MKMQCWLFLDWLVWRLFPVASLIYTVHMRVIGELMAIGDSEHPVYSPALEGVCDVLNFPMFYLWDPLGDWLKLSLTDNGVTMLFGAVNALFWAIVLERLLPMPRLRMAITKVKEKEQLIRLGYEFGR